MSVTVTSNPITRNTLHILADYEIHHTGQEDQQNQPAPPPNTDNPNSDIARRNETIPTEKNGQENNDADTDTNTQQFESEQSTLTASSWRGMPTVRPPNRDLDFSERPIGANPLLRTVISVMFTGVYFKAALAQTWGKTLGRYYPDLFAEKVGGEW